MRWGETHQQLLDAIGDSEAYPYPHRGWRVLREVVMDSRASLHFPGRHTAWSSLPSLSPRVRAAFETSSWRYHTGEGPPLSGLTPPGILSVLNSSLCHSVRPWFCTDTGNKPQNSCSAVVIFPLLSSPRKKIICTSLLSWFLQTYLRVLSPLSQYITMWKSKQKAAFFAV